MAALGIARHMVEQKLICQPENVSKPERVFEDYVRQAALELCAGEDGAEEHHVSWLPTQRTLLETWVPAGIYENSPNGSESQTLEGF